MPYILPETRAILIDDGASPCTPGELNFMITTLCLDYLEGEESYSDYNEVVGVLECAKLEFYRRAIATLEDERILKNGDVY